MQFPAEKLRDLGFAVKQCLATGVSFRSDIGATYHVSPSSTGRCVDLGEVRFSRGVVADLVGNVRDRDIVPIVEARNLTREGPNLHFRVEIRFRSRFAATLGIEFLSEQPAADELRGQFVSVSGIDCEQTCHAAEIDADCAQVSRARIRPATVGSASLRRKALSLEKAFSMGFISGL